MKSLEIANKLYEDIKELCDYYLSREWNLEKEKFCSKTCKNICDLIETLQKDKQDLEVLEIIRKKRVDMKLFAMFCVALTNEEILFSYNSNCSYEDEKLTMEELLKLKQWLERGNIR